MPRPAPPTGGPRAGALRRVGHAPRRAVPGAPAPRRSSATNPVTSRGTTPSASRCARYERNVATCAPTSILHDGVVRPPACAANPCTASSRSTRHGSCSGRSWSASSAETADAGLHGPPDGPGRATDGESSTARSWPSGTRTAWSASSPRDDLADLPIVVRLRMGPVAARTESGPWGAGAAAAASARTSRRAWPENRARFPAMPAASARPPSAHPCAHRRAPHAGVDRPVAG